MFNAFHAALLLLMLEAVDTELVFTISLKRSTQNLQLSTSLPADYPIFHPDSDQITASRRRGAGSGHLDFCGGSGIAARHCCLRVIGKMAFRMQRRFFKAKWF